ncbi:MAG TPA: hypothetical protein VK919_12550 [Solirubrobacterales bacterium]|nr:hypothetical protein [Solirubrobacterales bacterium]
MRTRDQHSGGQRRLVSAVIAAALSALCLALAPSPAAAQTGGVSADGGGTDGGGGGKTVPGRKAKLRNGLAIPPEEAPARVKKVIRAANEIAKGKDYCYGGGHARFESRCYDCSGAASYALKGGNFVSSPMPSSGYFRWGKRGKGKWITVFTHSGHMYLKVAGLRFDTSMVPGKGPGWSDQMRSARGFKKRHKGRF